MVVDDIKQSVTSYKRNLFKEFDRPASRGSRNVKREFNEINESKRIVPEETDRHSVWLFRVNGNWHREQPNTKKILNSDTNLY